MKVKKFKVGDRVKLTGYDTYYNSELKSRIGLTGTIKKVSSDEYGVEFDEFIDGHKCSGACKMGHGQYIYEKDLELVSSNTTARIPVGSKVKVVRGYRKSDIGILEIDDNSYRPYKVSFENEIVWYFENEIELYIEPAAEPTPPTPSKPKIPTGDELILSSRTLDKFKYIARDQNGWLFAYTERPIKDIGGTQWYSSSYYMELPKELFKFIKWGDLPTEIKNIKGGQNGR